MNKSRVIKTDKAIKLLTIRQINKSGQLERRLNKIMNKCGECGSITSNATLKLFQKE